MYLSFTQPVWCVCRNMHEEQNRLLRERELRLYYERLFQAPGLLGSGEAQEMIGLPPELSQELLHHISHGS